MQFVGAIGKDGLMSAETAHTDSSGRIPRKWRRHDSFNTPHHPQGVLVSFSG